MELDALDHVGLLVSDIDRSIDWYERVLGLERAYEHIARAEPDGADIKYAESDHRVSKSLYLHDPDLHLVEITTYEIPPENASAGKKPE